MSAKRQLPSPIDWLRRRALSWRRSAERDPWRAAAAVLAWGTLVAIVAVAVAPWFKDMSTFGFHDWDAETSHRQLVKASLLRYHEMPWWNPYACGGYTAWGYIEADTTVVSPYLLPYLVLPMSVALRVEVVGQALIGAVGAYLFASSFTRSHAARALVAALWAVNGRWGLQTASGHTWHLAYAWMPWCGWFYERARTRLGGPNAADLAGAAAAFAMLVYSGGIYPLPHTIVVLGLYAATMSVLERSVKPLVVLGATGLLGAGLAAPKLLPLLDGFRKVPRLIDSSETLDLGALVTMLTSRDQAFYDRPAHVSAYGWHEWGIYIGVAGLAIVVSGFVFVEGRRESALKLTGLCLVILGFGAFHPMAPWTLMHNHLPVFRSQHVPSRFLYPAVLVLGLVAAAGIGRWVRRRSISAPWLDLAAGVLVLWIGVDVASIAQKPMANAMWMVPPKIDGSRPFHFSKEPPYAYKKRDWAGPMYLAMLGNTGVLNCYGTPPFERKGARATDDPRYAGEVRVEGGGTAQLAAWSPNRATIDVAGASPGAMLVYNMNYDEGWHVDATGERAAEIGPVVPADNAVGVRLPGGSARVTFYYRPPLLGAGVAIGALTALALYLVWRRERASHGSVAA